MKLEVGMYYRDISGNIKKLNDIDLKFEMINQCCKKASYNIIDLIEVGDYINGYKVSQVGKSIENRKYITTEAYHKINYGNVFEGEIETILTKEQFERESYKI